MLPSFALLIFGIEKGRQGVDVSANGKKAERSPHGAEVPAPYGRVVRCGELAAVVVGAPLARGKLQLTFALQGGAAGDLRRAGTHHTSEPGREFHPNGAVTGRGAGRSISIIRLH